MDRAAALLAFTILTTAGMAKTWQSRMPPDVGFGNVAWFDVTTSDLARAKAFYGQLLGWTFNPVTGTDQAAEIVAGGRGIGTIRVAEGAVSGYNGVVYIQVADLKARSSRAVKLGATLVPGFPIDLPGGTGAIALIIDPMGHPIGLYSPAPLPSKP